MSVNSKIVPDIACFAQGKCPRLLFVLNKDHFFFFFRFLQHGFWLPVLTGKSVKEMLCDQFGLNPDYVNNRIQTVFYNGSPVDNMEAAMVRDGGMLALSAAMPGLVGATFRSGGVLSSFRASISYRSDDTKNTERKKGVIFIKLFNLLIPEIGPGFLSRGILIEKTNLNSFLKDQTQNFWTQIRSVLLNDLLADPEKLKYDSLTKDNGWAFLRVKAEDKN